MSDTGFGTIAPLLFILLSSAHLLGYILTRLRQPRVVGEILAGLLLAPVMLGRIFPAASTALARADMSNLLGFVYQLGLILLMFASGAETHGLFGKEDRQQVGILGLVGTGIPFVVALLAAPFVRLDRIAGRAGPGLALTLVLAIAVAVTSIPMISKILHDLNILGTRFARLVLGVAVLEDIALWAVLALAMALARSGGVPQSRIVAHVLAAIGYFAVGLFVAPVVFKRLTRTRWNVLARTSPIGYAVSMLFAYIGLAAILGVSLVFAAFLAGFAMASEANVLGSTIESISKFSFAVFVPIYFAIVGYRLDLGRGLSVTLLIGFLLGSCALKLLSAGVAARIAGFDRLGSLNLAVALNARGGPGIVLASVAFDAGIINASFYTALVVTAVLTSQAAGAWLDFVLKHGGPLLGTTETREVAHPLEEAA
jgi:Kef-type K+ transport system membrane component KefB